MNQRPRRRGPAVLIVLAAACSTRNEPAPTPSASGSATVAGARAAPGDAAVIEDAPADASLKQHMFEHFSAISELQRAIAHGHLDEAKQHAQWLLDHAEPTAEGWRPYVDEMRAAAGEVARAPDLPMAAALAARLGRACSRCHAARSAVITFAWEPAPDESPDLQVQMKRHQWAAARLWEGLVGPSDEMWIEGTSVLAGAKLDAWAATGGAPRGDVAALAAKVRQLAARATKITALSDRELLYGELLSTCAGCHQLVRPSPVPGP